MLGPYHSLCPLEEPSAEERPSQVFGMRTAMFKGISVADGAGYALRRIDGRQVVPCLSVFRKTLTWIIAGEVLHQKNGSCVSFAMSGDNK